MTCIEQALPTLWLEKLVLSSISMLFEEAPWDSIYDGFVKQWLDYWKIEPLLNAGTQVKYKFGSNEYISTIEGISQTGLGMAARPLYDFCWGFVMGFFGK